MTRLILIRHGETNWNVEHRKQGRNDQPLNEKGAAQAKLAADHVKANYNIAKVWSSPLQRCSNTAALFNLPVATSEHLLEIDYGEWEGMLTAEIEAQNIGQTNASADELDPPGGELRSNLPIRANHWIVESKIKEQAKKNEDVVLVGHGGAMKGLLVALLDLPDQAMNTLVIDNCSISVVDINPNPKITNRLVALNHTAHLTA
jgi:ribonuclease H / adenosylcobalamin/alpha-ribazole phosphatase